MNLNEHQKWITNFYKKRDWYQYSTFIRLNYLNEETGELSRAIRTLEIGRDHPGENKKSIQQLDYNLKEELADTLDQLLILCSKYQINANDLLKQSEAKLHQRFPSQKE